MWAVVESDRTTLRSSSFGNLSKHFDMIEVITQKARDMTEEQEKCREWGGGESSQLKLKFFFKNTSLY